MAARLPVINLNQIQDPIVRRNFEEILRYAREVIREASATTTTEVAATASTAAETASEEPETGEILGMAYAETTDSSTGATTIPGDDTVPQITEGNLILTLEYTPVRSDSYLIIEANTYLSETANTGDFLAAAVFKNTQADAVAVGFANAAEAGGTNVNTGNIKVIKRIDSGSTQLATFTLRVGNNTGNVRWNGSSGGRKYGGVMATALKITEVAR